MHTQKYNYIVNMDLAIVKMGEAADVALAPLCPVMVGKARATVATDSDAALLVGHASIGKMLLLSKLLGRTIDPIEHLLFAVASSEITRRYVAGELDPRFHGGDQETLKLAQSQLELEEASSNTVSTEATEQAV